jgi:hypothetical protein
VKKYHVCLPPKDRFSFPYGMMSDFYGFLIKSQSEEIERDANYRQHAGAGRDKNTDSRNVAVQFPGVR